MDWLPGAGRVLKEEQLLNEYKLLFWNARNVLELDKRCWLHNIVNVLDAMKLLALE